MVFSKNNFGFYFSKEKKLPDPKKIQATVNMSPFKNPHQIQVFNGMAQFYKCYYYGAYYWIDQKNKNFSLDRGVLETLGFDKTKVYWSTNIDIIKLASGVLCSYKCIITSYRSYAVSKFNNEEWSIGGVCF